MDKYNYIVSFTFAIFMFIGICHYESVMAFAPSQSPPIQGQSPESSPSVSPSPNDIMSPQLNATDESNFLTYNNAEHGITIKYPSDWPFFGDILEATGVLEIVVFDSPPGGDTDGSSYVMVSVNRLVGNNTSVIDYLNQTIDFNRIIMSNFSQDVQSNFNLIDSKTPDNGIILSGMPAYELVFTYVHNGTNYKRMEVGTIAQGKAYFVTYETELASYDKYLPVARKMIDSFRIS